MHGIAGPSKRRFLQLVDVRRLLIHAMLCNAEIRKRETFTWELSQLPEWQSTFGGSQV